LAKRRDKNIQNHARALAKVTGLKYNEALYQLKLYRSEKMTTLIKESLMATEETEHKVPAEAPRVSRSELVMPGEVFTLNSWDTADGKTRLLFPMDATDEELEVGTKALEESDEQLEALRKVHEYVESFESDEEVIERCYGEHEHQIKVTYHLRGEDTYSQAYIEQATGEGTDKHSGVPVVVKWFDEYDEWRQVDPWNWEWDEINSSHGWKRVTE
jgi:hypothetical protein